MPKVKTNSSAKKRFKITGSGEVTFQKPFKRHILTKKSKMREILSFFGFLIPILPW
jgi:large subunit ribosomal protein L35